MKFYCCGLIYSTKDPDTYLCIETYKLKTPTKPIFQGLKVVKEILYVLNCKKNGCIKAELQRYIKMNTKLKKAEVRYFSGEAVTKLLSQTANNRTRLPQICPIKTFQSAKNIPWVYGKNLDGYTQVIRYLDESGNRKVCKNNKLHSEIIKTEMKIIKPLHSTL